MLKLGSVAAIDVLKRGVCPDDVQIAKSLQLADVAREVVLKPFSAEGERAEFAINDIEEASSLAVANRRLPVVLKLLHVVATVKILVDMTFAS